MIHIVKEKEKEQEFFQKLLLGPQKNPSPALKLMRVNLIGFVWPKRYWRRERLYQILRKPVKICEFNTYTNIKFKNLSKRVPGVRIGANLMVSSPNLLQGIFNDPKKIHKFTHNLQRSALSAGVFGFSIGSPTSSFMQEQPVTSRIGVRQCN